MKASESLTWISVLFVVILLCVWTVFAFRDSEEPSELPTQEARAKINKKTDDPALDEVLSRAAGVEQEQKTHKTSRDPHRVLRLSWKYIGHREAPSRLSFTMHYWTPNPKNSGGVSERHEKVSRINIVAGESKALEVPDDANQFFATCDSSGYSIFASAKDFGTNWSLARQDFGAASQNSRELIIDDGGTILGKVVDSEGAPIDASEIRISLGIEIGATRTTKTDRFGRFEFSGLRYGSYQVELIDQKVDFQSPLLGRYKKHDTQRSLKLASMAFVDNSRAGPSRLMLRLASDDPLRDVLIPTSDGCQVTVVARNSQNKILAGQKVLARPQRMRIPAHTGVTNERGTVVFDDLRPGEWNFHFGHPKNRSSHYEYVSIRAGQTKEITLVRPTEFRVRISARDAKGSPIAGVFFRVAVAVEGAGEHNPGKLFGPTDSEGFAISPKIADSRALINYAASKDSRWLLADPETMPSWQENEKSGIADLEVRFKEARILEGSFLLPTVPMEHPAGGRFLRWATLIDSPDPRDSILWADVAATGRFRVKVYAEGPYSVRRLYAGYEGNRRLSFKPKTNYELRSNTTQARIEVVAR